MTDQEKAQLKLEVISEWLEAKEELAYITVKIGVIAMDLEESARYLERLSKAEMDTPIPEFKPQYRRYGEITPGAIKVIVEEFIAVQIKLRDITESKRKLGLGDLQ